MNVRRTVLIALFVAACADEKPDTPPPPPVTPPGPDALEVIQGLELYAKEGCAACHCNDAQGGCNVRAPNLQGISRDAIDANLRFAATADELPTESDPFDPHPLKLPGLADRDVDRLALFLSTLKGGAQIEDRSLIGQGYNLYVSGQCIACHLTSGLGTNQGGLGQPIAGTDPDNLYYVLTGGTPCHPLQRTRPANASCSLIGEYITDNETVQRLTDIAPPNADDERTLLAYFLAFISPPPSGGVVEPCSGVSGQICTVAGNGIGGFTKDDVTATETLIYFPQNIALTDWNQDGSVDLAIDDWNNHRIRIVYLDRAIDGVTNRIISIAGTGKVTGDDALNHPTDIAFDGEGALVIAGWHNQNLYRYARGLQNGADREQPAGLCDLRCPPESDQPTRVDRTFLGLPVSLAIHPDGRVFFSENACRRIRVLTKTGTVARQQPSACIAPVNLQGGSTIATVAGRNMAGYTGDDGPAREAIFNPFPGPTIPNFGIALEQGENPGRLYVADSGNNVIRYVDLTASPPTIHLLAGSPARDGAGFRDGVGEAARFNFPTTVYVDAQRRVYVTDSRNHALRRIDPDTKEVVTIAGTGRAGFNGDNVPAGSAQLNSPNGVVVHPDGRIFIADTNNNRIRVIVP
jgi:mono/diheme cytochrome c family protein